MVKVKHQKKRKKMGRSAQTGRFAQTPFFKKYKRIVLHDLPRRTTSDMFRSIKKMSWKGKAEEINTALEIFRVAFAEYASLLVDLCTFIYKSSEPKK